MTDEASPPVIPTVRKVHDWNNDPDGLTRADMNYQDGVLQGFLEAVFGELQPDTNSEFTLTVTIGGVTVSGYAIPRGRWQVLATQQLRGGGLESASEGFKLMMDSSDGLINSRDARRADEDIPVGYPRFIHFRDAVIRTGTSNINAPTWRGDLRQLSGWTFGA